MKLSTIKKHLTNLFILSFLTIITVILGMSLRDQYGWNNAMYTLGWIGGSLYQMIKIK